MTPPCPPREWIRISYIVIHPEPELRTSSTVPDEICDILVGHFLTAKAGDHAVNVDSAFGPDLVGEDTAKTE